MVYLSNNPMHRKYIDTLIDGLKQNGTFKKYINEYKMVIVPGTLLSISLSTLVCEVTQEFKDQIQKIGLNTILKALNTELTKVQINLELEEDENHFNYSEGILTITTITED